MLVAAYVTLGGVIPLNQEIMQICIFIRTAEVRHCQPRHKRGYANLRRLEAAVRQPGGFIPLR